MDDMISKKVVLDALINEIIRLLSETHLHAGDENMSNVSRRNARADAVLPYALVPFEGIEAVAAGQMYRTLETPVSWERVEKEEYRNAAFSQFAKYLREPYGRDCQSNLPHLFLLAADIACLCALEIQDGTLPPPRDAVKRMYQPKPKERP